MKKRIRKIFKTSICILLILSLSGCWNRHELDTLAVVMGVGIDKPANSEKVQITAQVVKPGEIKIQSKESGGSSQAFWNVTSTGDTIYSTIRDLSTKSSRKMFFPHNQILIFDRSIAEEGIQKYIDFFMRNPETRMNVWVLISEGKAMDVLDVKSELEKIPANNIAKLIEGEEAATSQIRAVRLRDMTSKLMSKTTASTAPFIKISSDGDKKAATISETAVFKGDKLIGSMDKREGRGLMWILKDMKSGIIEVNDSNDDKVSLEIIRSKTKIVPEIIDDQIKIKIIIHEEGNIGEQTGPQNLLKLPEVASLEAKKAEVIKDEVMAAVKKAQELNADVFGFGDAVHKKYKKEWKNLEGDWDEIFKNVQVEVHVDAKLRLMGRILKPSVPEKEE